jgi:alpha-D-ribose 1-methylphosphonate 5-phosphate C-P lyase
VRPLEFDDVPFRIEDQRGWRCWKSDGANKFMTEIPQADGSAMHEISDTSYLEKLVVARSGGASPAESYYDDDGRFHIAGYLRA